MRYGFRPTRSDLNGMSASEFKTALRMQGFRVSRDFYRKGSVARYGGRLYRFRWWSDDWVCDISCPVADFDRWANSVDKQLSIGDTLLGFKF